MRYCIEKELEREYGNLTDREFREKMFNENSMSKLVPLIAESTRRRERGFPTTEQYDRTLYRYQRRLDDIYIDNPDLYVHLCDLWDRYFKD